jgi:hypothetical protein
VLLILSILGFWHLRRTDPDAEVLAYGGKRGKVATSV